MKKVKGLKVMKKSIRLFFVAFISFIFTISCSSAAREAGPLQIALRQIDAKPGGSATGPYAIVVSGLSTAELQSLKSAAWQEEAWHALFRVSVSGNDSTAAGFSVAGQRPSSNSTTLDGLTFGGAGVPQDAVRNTRVITNSYDVARGQFSGGQVATTTMGGTNSVRGTGNYGLRDRDLATSTGDSTAFAEGFTQHQLSAGIGGPLVRNKVFYFISGQGRFRDDGLHQFVSRDAHGDGGQIGRDQVQH